METNKEDNKEEEQTEFSNPIMIVVESDEVANGIVGYIFSKYDNVCKYVIDDCSVPEISKDYQKIIFDLTKMDYCDSIIKDGEKVILMNNIFCDICKDNCNTDIIFITKVREVQSSTMPPKYGMSSMNCGTSIVYICGHIIKVDENYKDYVTLIKPRLSAKATNKAGPLDNFI